MMEGSYPPPAAVDTDQGPDLAPLPEPQAYPIPDKEKLNLDLKVCLVSIVLPFAMFALFAILESVRCPFENFDFEMAIIYTSGFATTK